MAKLLTYYRLCPLIDIKSLLGISEDSEKGVVIVTLGKNIVIKYRLSDQKQIYSWRTKEKFSSLVIYDKNQEKYVAVFNQSFVKFWTDEDDTLDRVKKYKFNQQIHTLLKHKDEIFILFKNGSLYPLKEILEKRKTFIPEHILENTVIHDVLYMSLNENFYVGYIVKTQHVVTLYWTNYNYSKNRFSKIQLKREDAALSGYVFHQERNLVNLLTVWSDGRIYSQTLEQSEKEISNPGDLLTVIENISTTQLVQMVTLDENYIAIYGADPNEEGAVLLIYNTQFKVTQSKQILKLYTNDSKIWRIDNTILLPVGQYLVVAPFCLESEQLAALVGSHKPLDNKIDSDISFVTEFEVVTWQHDNERETSIDEVKDKKLSESFKKRIKELMKQGLPESLIVEQIIPEILEEKDISLVTQSLSFFTDIPEKFLAQILKFALSCSKKLFETKCKSSKMNNLPVELLPFERISLIDKILAASYSDILLLPHLRSQLSIEEAILLLQYLIFMLSEDGHNLPLLNSVKTEKCIINWSCLLIDSNYQKFVLSKDDDVEKILHECKRVVLDHLEILEDLKKISPVLGQFEEEAKGKNYGGQGFANTLYSVEQLSLY